MLKSWWNRMFARTFGTTKRIVNKRRLGFEPLEERALLSINVTQVLPYWTSEVLNAPIAWQDLGFNNAFTGFASPGTIAYDDVSNIIMAAPNFNGDIEQNATGSTTWK